MLSGDDNENSQKQAVDLVSKITTLHMQHTFLRISSPLFCTTTTRNFQKLPGYTFYALLFTFFVAAADFHLGGRQRLFLTAAIKFSCFSSNEIGLLCFLSLALALSLLSMSMQTLRLTGKKESDLLLLFLSLNVWEAMRFNAKTRVCLKCKISPRLT